MAESIVIYRSYMDAAEDMTEEEEKEFYYAIIRYAFKGEQPTFKTPLPKSVFTAIRHGLDKNMEKSAKAQKAANARWGNGKVDAPH